MDGSFGGFCKKPLFNDKVEIRSGMWCKQTLKRGVLAVILSIALGTTGHSVLTTYVYEDGGDLIVESSGYLSLSQWRYDATLRAGVMGYFKPHFENDPLYGGEVELGWLEGLHDVYFADLAPLIATGDRPLSPSSSAAETLTGSANFFFHLGAQSYVYVSAGLATNSLLEANMTFTGKTISGMGLSLGTSTIYAGGDSFVFNIGQAPPVPDTGSTAALLGAGAVALAFARRRLG